MKLLFLENREKTFLYVPIAARLASEGHEINWLVQNKQYTPTQKNRVHTINYPKGVFSINLKMPFVEQIISIDRQQNHFKKKGKSYFYYYNEKIAEILEKIRPEIVFGESTAFHELLTIENCKQRNILYLNPSTCRYPVGRFSFYKYNTLEPYLGSGEILTDEEASDIIENIIEKKVLPDYMKPVSISKKEKIKNKAKKVISYFIGEKYNTPNPFVKYKIEQLKKRNIKIWDNNAISGIKNDSKIKVLYPLQMQPEANIDVWGRKWRNQSELVTQLSELLPDNCELYVKPNPKSKYELTQKLIDVCVANDKIIPLMHKVKMPEVFNEMDLVVTVTGTIAIECILSNKPVVTLVKTLNNDAVNCVYLDHISGLSGIIQQVINKKFIKSTVNQKVDFIKVLNKTSFKGEISDPFSSILCISNKNIKNLYYAFNQILNYHLKK